MMSIVTVKMMISKKSKKLYTLNTSLFQTAVNIKWNKTEFQKLSEHYISFKKNKMPGYYMQIKIILNLCIIHI